MDIHHDSSDLVQWSLYDLNTPGEKKKKSDSFTDIRHSKIQRGVFSPWYGQPMHL